MNPCYILEPEVAGQLGEDTVMDTTRHPPEVSRLHYEFDGWLGDDLLESFPCFIITGRVKRALEEMSLSGCLFDSVKVSRSETFRELHPDEELPDFFWLKVSGTACVDDFGLTTDNRLVVTERTLKCLQEFHLNNCLVKEYR